MCNFKSDLNIDWNRGALFKAFLRFEFIKFYGAFVAETSLLERGPFESVERSSISSRFVFVSHQHLIIFSSTAYNLWIWILALGCHVYLQKEPQLSDDGKTETTIIFLCIKTRGIREKKTIRICLLSVWNSVCSIWFLPPPQCVWEGSMAFSKWRNSAIIKKINMYRFSDEENIIDICLFCDIRRSLF